jgi:tetratricopeptide (TPR) repeat protein
MTRTVLSFLIANWALLSFLAAGAVAIYVKYRFGVDYFESYRNISTTNKLSSFYQKMGDRLMASSEWEAAEQAYRAALQIRPNNSEATFGVVKAEIFQPMPGQDFYVPDVVDAKLDYLLSCFPDDYQIWFLKGLRCLHRQEYDEAKELAMKCVAKMPRFVGSYFLLGNIDIAKSAYGNAATYYSKALEFDPNFAAARNNLAACYMLTMKFEDAVKQFENSYRISPTGVTAFALGEAYWFSRNFDNALEIHQAALSALNASSGAQDRYISGGWQSMFLPLRAGDVETVKMSVFANTLEQKKSLLHFEVAIDYALLGCFPEAEQEFNAALKLEHPSAYRKFFVNRILSIAGFIDTPQEVKSWLQSHRKMLESDGRGAIDPTA